MSTIEERLAALEKWRASFNDITTTPLKETHEYLALHRGQLYETEQEIKVIRVRLTRIEERLDFHSQRMEELAAQNIARIDKLEDQIEERMNGMEGRMNGMEERMSGMEGRMSKLEQQNTTILSKLDQLLSK